MIATNDSLSTFCNFDNTPLPDTFEIQPHIYVTCLNAYIYGEPHGLWIDATQKVEKIIMQIFRMLAANPVRGPRVYLIQTYNGFQGVKIEKYGDIEDVHKKALFVSEHGELGAKLISYYWGGFEDAQEALDQNYIGEYKNELDYAIEFFNESYNLSPKVQAYIDYESFKMIFLLMIVFLSK